MTLSGIPGPTTGRLAFRYFVENGGPSGANSDYIGIDRTVYTGPCVTPTPTPTPTPNGDANSHGHANSNSHAYTDAYAPANADSYPTATPTATPTPTPATCVRVTATAGVTGPTFYATLKDAFDAINAGTHQGAITIDILCDTVETASAVLNASGGPSSYASVLIQPSGGAPRTVSGAIERAVR